MKNAQGIFYGNYTVHIEKSDLLDFSKRAFLFSGQGVIAKNEVQSLHNSSPFIKKRVKETDEFLAKHKVMTSSEYVQQKESDKTPNLYITKNLTAFAVQVGLFETLVMKNIRPAVITGHSFGEFATLVCAGVVSFSDMLEIIYLRELCSPPEKSLGYMIAMKDSPEVREYVNATEGVYLANINSPEQVVLAVKKDKKEDVYKYLTSKKIAHVELGIPQPYHSEMMRPTTKQFMDKIKGRKFTLTPPVVPFFSSVLHRFVDLNNFEEEDFYYIIEHQMLEQVQYVEQITSIFNLGIRNFLEVSLNPGLVTFVTKTLAGQKVKAFHAFKYLNVTSKSAEEKPSENYVENKKVMGVLNKVLALVTGYELQSIKVYDRMQEDLGIDSIKKAEIIFKVLDQMGATSLTKDQNINLSNLSTIQDIITYFDRQDRLQNDKLSVEGENKAEHDADYYRYKTQVVRWKNREISALEKSLWTTPEILEVVYKDKKNSPNVKDLVAFYSRPSDKPLLIQMKLDPPLSLKKESIVQDAPKILTWYQDLIEFFRDFNIAAPWCDGPIFMQVIYEAHNRHFCSSTNTFIKSWAMEQGSFGFKAIEVEKFSDQNFLWEMMDPNNSQIRYENGKRWIQEFVDIDLKPKAEEKILNNIVIFAGHRGVGWEVTKDLLPKVKNKILIVGRTPKDHPELVTRFAEVGKLSAKIVYVAGDLKLRSTVINVLQDFTDVHGPVDLLINSVGYASNKVLSEITVEQYEQEVSTKISVGINVLEAQEKFKIEESIHFSSVVSQFGNGGQAAYCLSNSFLDVLPQIYKGVKVAAWPPWGKVGLSGEHQTEFYINLSGISYLTISDGVKFLNQIMNAENTRLSVCIYDEASKKRYVKSCDDKFYRQFFTENQSPTISRNLDLTGFNLNDLKFLNDHLLSGQPIVAASNMIALFLCVGYMNWNQVPLIEDFEGFNFMFVQKNQSVFSLELIRKKEDGVDVIQNYIKSTMLHSKGKMSRVKSAPLSKKMNIPRYEHQIDSSRVLNPVVQVVRSFHFDVITWCDPVKKNVYLEFNRSSLHRCTEVPLFDFTFQLIEICHQTLGTTANWRTDMVAVPKAVKRFALNEEVEWTERLFSLQEITSSDDKSITGNAWVTNDRGEVIAEIIGMNFSYIQKYESQWDDLILPGKV